MFTWLSHLPQWFQILFSVFILILFIYVLITTILPLFKKGVTFKNGDKLILFGNSQPNTLAVCTNQGGESCPFRKDLLLFLNESTRLLNERYTILFVNQIKDQMNYTEQKLDQVRMKLHGIYLSKLKDKGATVLVQNKSFVAYKYILRDIQKDMIKLFRYFFRENHFCELNELEFTNYITSKFEYLASELTDALNDIYYDDEHITREELHEYNKEYILDIKPFIVEIFQYARSVSIDYKVQLLEIDEKIDNLVKRFINK